MTTTTWAELSQRKLTYVCRHGIDHLEYCRAIAAHMRWEAQGEQWMIALFVGTAFILLSVAASMLLTDRRQRAAASARKPRARSVIKTAPRRLGWQPAPSEPALAQMIRLSDDLARRRMVYPRPLPAVPDVMVIDVGEPYRNPSLPLGRYYPIMVENEDELAEFERFLAVERAEAVAPDLLDRRPSQIVSDEVLTCRFDPPAEGWPWITLFRWPPGFQEAASRHGVDMARGCYTIELADSQSEADLGAIAVLEQLAARHETELRLLAADLMAIGGRAQTLRFRDPQL